MEDNSKARAVQNEALSMIAGHFAQQISDARQFGDMTQHEYSSKVEMRNSTGPVVFRVSVSIQRVQ